MPAKPRKTTKVVILDDQGNEIFDITDDVKEIKFGKYSDSPLIDISQYQGEINSFEHQFYVPDPIIIRAQWDDMKRLLRRLYFMEIQYSVARIMAFFMGRN